MNSEQQVYPGPGMNLLVHIVVQITSSEKIFLSISVHVTLVPAF